MLEKLHIIISILAGAIFTLFCIVFDKDFSFWLFYMIIILILFYIIGVIIKNFIIKILTPHMETEENIELTSLEEQLDNTNDLNFSDEDKI